MPPFPLRFSDRNSDKARSERVKPCPPPNKRNISDTAQQQYHSEDASFAHSAMVSSGRLVVTTFLAVSQISALATLHTSVQFMTTHTPIGLAHEPTNYWQAVTERLKKMTELRFHTSKKRLYDYTPSNYGKKEAGVPYALLRVAHFHCLQGQACTMRALGQGPSAPRGRSRRGTWKPS